MSTTITLNNLNFNPSLMRTHNGLLMDNLVQEKSHSFIQNEKLTVNNQGKNAVTAFYFYMQNNMIYNERYYKKFQDLLSNIGGIGSFILLIGLFINKLVSYYVILLDTQDLIFSKEELNFVKDKLFKKLITLEKEINFQIKNNMNNNTLQNSNYPLFFTDKNENEKNSELLNLYIINKNKINDKKKNSISYLTNKKIKTEYKTVNHIKIPKSNSYDRNNKINHHEKLCFEIRLLSGFLFLSENMLSF
jgi:hypothetical protein